MIIKQKTIDGFGPTPSELMAVKHYYRYIWHTTSLFKIYGLTTLAIFIIHTTSLILNIIRNTQDFSNMIINTVKIIFILFPAYVIRYISMPLSFSVSISDYMEIEEPVEQLFNYHLLCLLFLVFYLILHILVGDQQFTTRKRLKTKSASTVV